MALDILGTEELEFGPLIGPLVGRVSWTTDDRRLPDILRIFKMKLKMSLKSGEMKVSLLSPKQSRFMTTRGVTNVKHQLKW